MNILDMIVNKQPMEPSGMPTNPMRPSGMPQSAPATNDDSRSFGQRMGDFFSDPDKVSQFIMALTPMMSPWQQKNPAVQLAQANVLQQRKDARLTKEQNKTIEFLNARGVDPKLLEQAKGNPDLINALLNKAFEAPQRPSVFSEKMAAARIAFPFLSEAELMDKVLAPASTTTMVLGDAESAFQKEAGKGQAAFINKVAEGLPAAAQLETDVNRLMALSEAVEKGSLAKIPNTMRRLIPTGIDPTSDAYTSQMLGVAQGLRQAGTGAQSERDMDLLIARAGSIGSDITARRIAHQALIEKARIDREMGQIARQIQINAGNPEKVQELQSQLDQLLMRPAMTEQMKNYLNGLTPDFSLEDIDAELQRRGQ